ncbi:LOW QUALITY PROTEIN: hypothetical protein AAY473_006031 [Plecturocebus cupreus]
MYTECQDFVIPHSLGSPVSEDVSTVVIRLLTFLMRALPDAPRSLGPHIFESCPRRAHTDLATNRLERRGTHPPPSRAQGEVGWRTRAGREPRGGGGPSPRLGVGRARSPAHRAVPTMACCRRRREGMRPGELGGGGGGAGPGGCLLPGQLAFPGERRRPQHLSPGARAGRTAGPWPGRVPWRDRAAFSPGPGRATEARSFPGARAGCGSMKKNQTVQGTFSKLFGKKHATSPSTSLYATNPPWIFAQEAPEEGTRGFGERAGGAGRWGRAGGAVSWRRGGEGHVGTWGLAESSRRTGLSGKGRAVREAGKTGAPLSSRRRTLPPAPLTPGPLRRWSFPPLGGSYACVTVSGKASGGLRYLPPPHPYTPFLVEAEVFLENWGLRGGLLLHPLHALCFPSPRGREGAAIWVLHLALAR